jgi:hypothetical protein
MLLLAEPDDAAWVDAGDVYANRPVSLPEALRESLAERSSEVVAAAVGVDSAGTFLGVNRQISPPDPLLNGRAHEERAVGALSVPGPAYGCER